MTIISKDYATSHSYAVRDNRGWGVFAGLFAGATMTFLMVVLIVTGITQRSLANLVADRLAGLFPPQFQEFFIQSIGPLGKDLLFYSVLLGQALAGGFLAWLFTLLWPHIPDERVLWRNSFIFTNFSYLLVITTGLPLLNVGFLGANLGHDQFLILFSTFLLFQSFAVGFAFFFNQLVPQESSSQEIRGQVAPKEAVFSEPPNRRRFVIVLSGFFLAALASGIGVGAFKIKTSGYWFGLGELQAGDKLVGEITPVESFYTVSKNAFDPVVSAGDWKLEVNGLVETPLTFDYNTIRQLPPETRYQTLTCISNPVGGHYIGNGEWKGTSLKGILEMAAIKPGVQKVVFTCADGYTDSITLASALDPQTLLAWEMNGATLPKEHGFPLRALIPNIYGMKNTKWIKEITLINTEYEGFWAKQGWDNVAVIHTESTITYPDNNAEFRSGERVEIRGLAFAGNRGIGKVELSFDGGKNWQETRLKDGLGPASWQLWRFDWVPEGANRNVNLMVRATDKTGVLQSGQPAEPFPAGSAGWHSLNVRII